MVFIDKEKAKDTYGSVWQKRKNQKKVRPVLDKDQGTRTQGVY